MTLSINTWEAAAGNWISLIGLVAAHEEARQEALKIRPKMPIELPDMERLLTAASNCPDLKSGVKLLRDSYNLQASAVERVSHAYRDACRSSGSATPGCAEEALCRISTNRRPATAASLAGLAIALAAIDDSLTRLDEKDPSVCDLGEMSKTADAIFLTLCRLQMK